MLLFYGIKWSGLCEIRNSVDFKIILWVIYYFLPDVPLCVHAQLLNFVWLCDPMDCSLTGLSVHRISQAIIAFVLCLVAQSCPTVCNPMDCSPPSSSLLGDSPGKNTGMSCHALLQPRDWSSQPRDRIQVPCIAGRFFTDWATRKPKNTGVRSLSLLQGLFLPPGIEPRSSALQVDSLPAELPGKPYNCLFLPTNSTNISFPYLSVPFLPPSFPLSQFTLFNTYLLLCAMPRAMLPSTRISWKEMILKYQQFSNWIQHCD